MIQAPAADLATDIRLWLQVAIFVFGCAGVALTVWRGSVGVRNQVANLKSELTRLADQVEKQNGYVRIQGEEIAALGARTSVTEALLKATIRREEERKKTE